MEGLGVRRLMLEAAAAYAKHVVRSRGKAFDARCGKCSLRCCALTEQPEALG